MKSFNVRICPEDNDDDDDDDNNAAIGNGMQCSVCSYGDNERVSVTCGLWSANNEAIAKVDVLWIHLKTETNFLPLKFNCPKVGHTFVLEVYG